MLAALLVELRSQPTLLVLGDLHWADEATLDVVRLLRRRVGGTGSLLVATYRDDELGPDDPVGCETRFSLEIVLIGERERSFGTPQASTAERSVAITVAPRWRRDRASRVSTVLDAGSSSC